MNEIIVRRLGVGDEAVVQYLTREDARFDEPGAPVRARPPHTDESAREFLADPATVHLVAFSGDEPVGQLLAYELTRRHGDGLMMFVYELGVREDYRRRGVGRMLFAELESVCRSRGIARAFVITNESNAAAMAFYQALGATRGADDDVVFDFSYS